MTPDPHAEVLRGGAGAPWAALVPEQLRFLEPDVVHGSWELSKSRETHQAVPAGKQAEGGRRPRDEPAADGLHTAPGAHRAGALTWCHPYLLSCILRSEVTAATVSWVHEPQKRGADAVARMAADRARLRSCCHPDLLLLGPQAKEGHDVPSRPDGPKQRPGSRERPRPRPPECCCRPPVRVWELARVTAPGTVAPAMAAGLLGLLRLSRRCCPTSEKGP
ncbi:uncharacterized protein LOC111092560 isoform X3 [Canis lupus familiaris]|uniref:uncharacterized protein LOC112660503 isoform X3 n=1 Tax=Canis lupus dingo TaxID=286419 RepID=UPI000DC75020|nr:uncharacterized protein LOC112660503 isoform X3 [Canis lupus dingo]XP_038385553.1 uncharacterized protein LOC111092560 isoform X3 [Canis lupus familiaris]XP_038513870.1 uncharacterized protein LOC111092560 isoform X3 [Canis lupus familiaris]